MQQTDLLAGYIIGELLTCINCCVTITGHRSRRVHKLLHCCRQVRALSKCTDCEVFVCDSCVAAHGRAAPLTSHHVISYVTDEDTDTTCTGLVCGSHEGQTLEFYCSDCETAVCEVITTKYS